MVTLSGRVLVLVGIVLLAGCLGGGGDGGASSNDEWCSSDASTQFVNPESGEQVSLDIRGVVDEDGRRLCMGVWETNQGDIQRMEMYWSEDESYRKAIMYDADGEVVNEVEITN